MTDKPIDDINPAKVREVVDGALQERNQHLDPHTGYVNADLADVLSWSRRSVDDVEETDAFEELVGQAATKEATEAVREGRTSTLAYLTGITEKDLDASKLTLPARIIALLERDGELATILAAGAPNSGKTNSIWMLAEVARGWWENLMVISNARADLVDERVTSAHDLAVALLENRDRPKYVAIDEASTHMDARTYSYEVASQWSPLQKRMSKLGVEVAACIGHTGKDVDPEVKRLTNLAVWKSSPETAEFFADWPADEDFPRDRLFGGHLEDLEPTSTNYDPDEPAPWSWNLRADLFAEDLDWDELLAELRSRGPA